MKKTLKDFVWGVAPLLLGGAFIISAVAIPELICVRGKERVSLRGHNYIVQYDKRDNGVVVSQDDHMASIADSKIVDTNYDGRADHVSNLAGYLLVRGDEQRLFSEVTSNFYKIHPTKESLFGGKIK